MEILVKTIRENEDGSGDVELELDQEAKMLLIGEGFISIIKEWIEQQKNANQKTKGSL